LQAISLLQYDASIATRVLRFSIDPEPVFSGVMLKSCYSPVRLRPAWARHIVTNERSYFFYADWKVLSWIKGNAGFAFHRVCVLSEWCAVQYLLMYSSKPSAVMSVVF
jgi:hypothetical protein